MNDTDESEEAAAARREYYKNDFQNQVMFKAFQQGGLIPADMDYEDWCFNSEMSLYHESFGKSEYAPYLVSVETYNEAKANEKAD